MVEYYSITLYTFTGFGKVFMRYTYFSYNNSNDTIKRWKIEKILISTEVWEHDVGSAL